MASNNERSNHELAMRMAELARATAPPRSIDEVLTGVTAAAVEMIPGTDTCGVLLIGKGGKFESLFGTSDLIYKLDELQEQCNEGPCVTAAVDELIVRTDDFTHERRWPKYSAAIADLGVRSGLSFKLYTGAQTAGALNLFGLQPHAFNGESEAIGSVLAAHAASAILASRHGEQLESAGGFDLAVVKFDADLVRKRFGEPAERLPVQDGMHWLYPSLGLDLLLGDNGGALLQYVPPAKFEQRLRTPLRDRESEERP